MNRMTDSLAHRGPSDRGVWGDEQVHLGSRRLSVIDLSRAGHQPMSNEDGSVHLVYNGEVYNFRELKAHFALEERGHTFRSRTDTEVLIHLYEELGPAMLWASLGVASTPRPDHAHYIGGWLKALANDKKFFFSAASAAQKAVDYLYSLQSAETAENFVRAA